MPWWKVNIAQVEFCHLGGDSIADIYKQAAERVIEGLEDAQAGSRRRFSGKTIVRFYDESGTLTKLALRAKKIRAWDRYIHTHFLSSRGLRRWYLNSKSRRVAREYLSLRAKTQAVALKEFRVVVRECRSVAVELADYSFRAMSGADAHELLEAAERAKSVMLFVFKHDLLLADPVESVGTVM